MAYGKPEDYEDVEKAALLVFKARRDSHEAFQPLREKKWRRAHLFYFGEHDLSMFAGNPSKYPWSSRLFVPTPLQQIETIAPRLATGLLADDRFVSVKPVLAANEKEEASRFTGYAQAVEVLMHNQLTQDVRLARQLPMWVRDALIYGTKWLFGGWQKRVGQRYEQVETSDGSGQFEWKVTDERFLLEDHVSVTGESIWDINPDPEGTTVENCAFVQREVDMSPDNLWAWIKATPEKPWKVRDRAKLNELLNSGKGEERYQNTMRGEAGRFSASYGGGLGSSGRGQVKLHLVDHYEDERHILVVGREGGPNVTLLLEPNPFPNAGKPFVRIVPTPLDSEIHGLGTIEMIEQLVHQVNSLTNLRMVNIIRATNMTGLVNVMSGLTAQQMMSQPAQFYNVTGAVNLDNCLRMESWPVVNNDARQEIDYCIQQIQMTGGASEPTMGQSDPNNRTARGIQSMIEQGAVRTAQQVHNVAESLRDMCLMMHAITHQFMTEARLERAFTPEGKQKWVTVDPRMMNRQYQLDFNCRPEAANKALMLQQFNNMLQEFAQWGELDRSHTIKTGIKLTGVAEPLAFLKQQTGDAEGENMKWLATGRIGDVDPADNHAYHMDVHGRIIDDDMASNKGPQAEARLRQHMTMHAQYRWGQQGGGPQPEQAEGAPSVESRMTMGGQAPAAAMAPPMAPQQAGAQGGGFE